MIKTIADWAPIVIAIAAVIAVIVTVFSTRKNLHLNKFVTLVQVISQELSDKEARIDRGLVKRIKSNEVEEIKRLVSLVREKVNTDETKYGEAWEMG